MEHLVTCRNGLPYMEAIPGNLDPRLTWFVSRFTRPETPTDPATNVFSARWGRHRPVPGNYLFCPGKDLEQDSGIY
ncbi:MAG: hypothetical protein CMJ81_00360 [Planctomycetaceae bacterium]|nr:hypothetical protein [Planctomycetaceae bacterium]MBP63298.1 hypothetical protein [Planctomycetaceae bacterium]